MDLELIKKSYLYNELYEQYGLDFIIDAGYYDNGQPYSLKADEHMIDFLDFKKRYVKGNKNALVYITGSFAPIHDGHINSVIQACKKLESEGYNVLGGVISPDHDKYVVDNKIHRNDLNINARITYIKDKLRENYEFPLVCDIWNGLFNLTAINFTELTEFLLDTLKLYDMQDDTELFFVCGGDNARFAKTFVHKHGAVIIDRPDYEDCVDKALAEISELNPEAKVYFAKGGSRMSSTQVRNENFTIQKTVLKKSLALKVENDEIDDFLSIKPLLEKYYLEVTPIFNKDFKEHLLNALEQIFYTGGDFKIICLDRKFYKYMQENFADSQIFARFVHFDISRVYRTNGLVRDGYVIKPFPKSETGEKCIVVDDDSVSGNTMRYSVKQIEKFGYEVYAGIVLNNVIPLGTLCEIMDLSDLIFNKENGGLVIAENNGQFPRRLPYVLPYVSPYDRASVNEPLDFSIDIIEWNKSRGRVFDKSEYYLTKFKELKYGLV